MNFPKLFRVESVISTTRATVFWRAVTNFNLVLVALEIVNKFCFSCDGSIAGSTVKIVRLPRV